LRWVNGQHIKIMADVQLAPLLATQLLKRGISADTRLPAICALFKDRCDTTVVLADWAAAFYADVQIKAEDLAQHVTDAIKPALQTLAEKLDACVWDKTAIAAVIKDVLTMHNLKMPQLAMPARVLLMGTPQTPSLDAIIAIFSREEVLKRLQKA
jgi:glutamyl-tRNA synthetase